MRSCNPWFWHIALGLPAACTPRSRIWRAFGLGSPTGIEIGEQVGVVPDPTSEVDAINLAIGQGGSLVTPLQVASFIAAVGNGGTLYGPRVIERVETVDGTVVYQFEPVVRGTLPISPENLAVVQRAMVTVIMNPRGTAYDTSGWGARLTSFVTSTGIGIAAKTGTAESGSGDPHAWFAGYTYDTGRERPDIAVVVLVENGGEGSQVAAPIFRRVLEIYYGSTYLAPYNWEASVGVLPTDTPEVTDTPEEEATETPAP
jgi:penicillin-binding protein 2